MNEAFIAASPTFPPRLPTGPTNVHGLFRADNMKQTRPWLSRRVHWQATILHPQMRKTLPSPLPSSWNPLPSVIINNCPGAAERKVRNLLRNDSHFRAAFPLPNSIASFKRELFIKILKMAKTAACLQRNSAYWTIKEETASAIFGPPSPTIPIHGLSWKNENAMKDIHLFHCQSWNKTKRDDWPPFSW